MTATVIIKYKSFLNCILPAFLAKYFPQAAQSTQEEPKNGLLWVGLKCIIGEKKKERKRENRKSFSGAQIRPNIYTHPSIHLRWHSTAITA